MAYLPNGETPLQKRIAPKAGTLMAAPMRAVAEGAADSTSASDALIPTHP
jgi:hypothetical protein